VIQTNKETEHNATRIHQLDEVELVVRSKKTANKPAAFPESQQSLKYS
jgi:hypothetical protein